MFEGACAGGLKLRERRERRERERERRLSVKCINTSSLESASESEVPFPFLFFKTMSVRIFKMSRIGKKINAVHNHFFLPSTSSQCYVLQASVNISVNTGLLLK